MANDGTAGELGDVVAACAKRVEDDELLIHTNSR
jgi:hypothetical protein